MPTRRVVAACAVAYHCALSIAAGLRDRTVGDERRRRRRACGHRRRAPHRAAAPSRTGSARSASRRPARRAALDRARAGRRSARATTRDRRRARTAPTPWRTSCVAIDDLTGRYCASPQRSSASRSAFRCASARRAEHRRVTVTPPRSRRRDLRPAGIDRVPGLRRRRAGRRSSRSSVEVDRPPTARSSRLRSRDRCRG